MRLENGLYLPGFKGVAALSSAFLFLVSPTLKLMSDYETSLVNYRVFRNLNEMYTKYCQTKFLKINYPENLIHFLRILTLKNVPGWHIICLLSCPISFNVELYNVKKI